MTRTKLNKLVAMCLTVIMVISFWMYMPIMKASAYPSAYPVPSLTGNQREDIVNVALSQKGYKKSGGTVYGAWYDSIKGTNYVNQAWCAMFVSWCANQAGIDQNVLTYRSYVPDMVSDFKSKGQWHDRNYTPSRGDIIIVNSSGHVGIVTGVSGRTVYTIEGNKTSLGSACGTDSYTIGSSYITGYGVPNYSDKSPSWEDYSIVNLGTSFCATISNSTTGGYLKNEGWNVSAYPGDNQKNQAWIFNQQSDGSYTITSMLDTARLTTCDRNSNNGASIVVSHDGVDITQKWYIYKSNQKGYILRPLHSDRVMDLDGGGYAAGTNIQLYEYNDTISQYYNINKINWYNVLSPSDIGTDFCAYIYNNTTGGYLDNEGWNVAAYPGHGGISQTFYFERQNDGSYIISSLLDNARLTTGDGEYNNRSSIVVTHDEINQSQKWYIYETTREYIFRPLQSDKVIDLDGGGYAAGTNIQLYEYNSTFPQYYGIKKVDYNLTINFDSNNGECSLKSKISSYKNTYGTLPTPTKIGCTFEGWFTQKDGGEKITSDTIVTATSDQTLYAHWKKINYEVYFDANGGKSDASCLSIYYNSTYDELANASREGYKFLGWYTEKEGGTLIKNDTVYNLTTNQTLYAHWEKINVKGDVNADGKFNISDVVILQKWLLAVPNTKLADWKAADLCEDDRLDVFDLCMMKRMLVNS